MEWLHDIMIYISNRTHFLWVYQRNKLTRDVARTKEKLEMMSHLEESDLQASSIVIFSTILKLSLPFTSV